MHLFLTEVRRHLRRRVIRVMIALALFGCVFAGVVAFASSSGRSVAALQASRDGSPAVLVDWWRPEQGDAALLTAAIFLLLGGFFAGAAVAGAEWRAGTVTTVLTWEPRRTRLHLTRTAACGTCAFVVAVLLQLVFLAAFLPSVLVHGTTDGTTTGWWLSLGLAIARTAFATALATMLGVSLATLGRNTAFALGVVFAWMAVIEGIVRGLRPAWGPSLWGESLVTTVQWARIEHTAFTRGPLASMVTVIGYSAVLVAAATLAFRRRDVATTT